MSFSIHEYTGDGSTSQFAVNFQSGYLSREDVRAFVEGEVDGLGDQIYRTLTWITDGLVNIGAAPANGLKVTIQRFTSIEQLTNDYSDGAILSAANLDSSNLQHLLVAQELKDTLPTNAALEVALVEAGTFSASASASAGASAASAAAASGSANAAAASAVTAQDAAALAVAVTTANGIEAATPGTLPLRTVTGAVNVGNATESAHALTLGQFSASNVLSRLLSVDGAGSGVDADLWKGKSYLDFSTTISSQSVPAHSYVTTTISDVSIASADFSLVAISEAGDNTPGVMIESRCRAGIVTIYTRNLTAGAITVPARFAYVRVFKRQ